MLPYKKNSRQEYIQAAIGVLRETSRWHLKVSHITPFNTLNFM